MYLQGIVDRLSYGLYLNLVIKAHAMSPLTRKTGLIQRRNMQYPQLLHINGTRHFYGRISRAV